MTNEAQWKKSTRIESGNYPKSSFVGILDAIYPSYNDKLDAYVLQLDFTDGKTYNIPLTISSDKAKTEDGVYGVHEDGTYDSFLAIGQFLDSIEKLDVTSGLPDENSKNRVQTFFAWENGIPLGFKSEPDIVGKKLHNVATNRTVGDDQQTSKYPNWTIGQIEGLVTKQGTESSKGKAKPGRPGKLPPQAQTKEPESKLPSEELTNAVLDSLAEPMSVSEIFTGLGKKHKVSEIRVALDQMKAQGIVTETGGKWSVT